MQITKLSVKRLYGFMNKDITFNERISILVGINGSGKTSVLNLINWMLTINLDELCLIEFEHIVLKFNFDSDDFEFTCTQNETEIVFQLTNITKKKIFPAIRAKFIEHPKNLTKNKDLRESIRGRYTQYKPDDLEIETWAFIRRSMPSPIIIGLDRNLYTQEGDELRIQEGSLRKATLVLDKKGLTPIDKVKHELVKNYNIYRNRVIDLYSLINRKIILSAFDDIITHTNLPEIMELPRPTIKEIEVLHLQVIEFLKENESGGSRRHNQNKKTELSLVTEYFENLKSILKTTSNKTDAYELLYLINITQFKKINDLVLEFKKYDEATARLYKPLEVFLTIVNSFLKDSSKELYFDQSTSQILFYVLDRNGKRIDSRKRY